MKNKIIKLAALVMLMGPMGAGATPVLLPAGFETTEGNNGEGTSLGAFSNTAQIVYSESLLSAAGISIGDQILGLAFRVDTNSPAPVWSVSDYQIRFATSLNAPGSLDPNFINNRGADYTVVRSGPLNYSGVEYPVSGSPNGFGPTISFSNFFTYLGGDLLLEYTHTLINSGGVFADGHTFLDSSLVQSQFSPGYDTSTAGFDGCCGAFGPILNLEIRASVPEPATLALLGLGLAGMGFGRRKKRV